MGLRLIYLIAVCIIVFLSGCSINNSIDESPTNKIATNIIDKSPTIETETNSINDMNRDKPEGAYIELLLVSYITILLSHGIYKYYLIKKYMK